MATRRIKDITNTATTFASDDFIALDGSTQGTRKMDKDDLIAEVSAGVSGDYLEEANNLSDVASLDTSKLNMEIPDVGTAPNEVPLNGQLGTMAYQDADGVSMGTVEAESLEVTDKITTKDVGGVTKGQVEFQDSGYTISGGSNLGDIRHDAPRHRWYSGATVLAQIDEGTSYFQNTSVGIGTSSPSSYNANGDDLVIGNGTGNRGLSIASGASDFGVLYFARGSAPTGADAYHGYINYNQSTSEMTIGTAQTAQWRVDASGNLVAAQAGNGIDFGSTTTGTGTPSGGLLDDYEVGTWTPALFTGTGESITYSGRSGTYTKIGRLVYVTGEMTVSSATYGTGTHVQLSGLPYDISQSWQNAGFSYGGSYGSTTLTTYGDITGAQKSSTAGNCYLQRGAYGGTGDVYAKTIHLNTSGVLQFNLTYITA